MNEKITPWDQNSPFESVGSRKEWLEGVEGVLKGADFDTSLVSKTPDGIEIQPLYQQQTDAPFYSRGTQPWSIPQSFDHGELNSVNKLILNELNAGTNAVELNFSSPLNTTALPCFTVTDLEQLLKGVQAQMIHLSLTPGHHNVINGALLLAYFNNQKFSSTDIHAALNIDPLHSLAVTGIAVEEPLGDLSALASHCAAHYPNVTGLCVDTSVYHNGGCTDAQELAYLLATAIEYVRAQEKSGDTDPQTAFNQIRYRLALDNDYFTNVVKLRAARELINQVANHCGVQNPTILIDTITGLRAFSTLDAASNILRTTTQATAAMTGGANSYHCAPYDLLSDQSMKAQRLARNTHHILIEESHILAVDDPTRGSGFIESLTAALCESAWSKFQALESQGGMLKSLQSGSVKNQIGKTTQDRLAALSTGDTALVGITDYPNTHEDITPKPSRNKPQASSTESSQAKAPSIVALIGALAEGETTSNYVTAYCSYTQTFEAISPFRDAEAYEQFRLQSTEFKNEHNLAPTLTLVTLGEQKEYAARVSFCKNFFAIAGIATAQVDIQDYTSKGGQLAVLCSSDKRYQADIKDISALNCKNLWVAGNHPKALAALSQHNVTQSIHVGCDRLQLLNNALTILGVTAGAVK